jgi:hypothetical protein
MLNCLVVTDIKNLQQSAGCGMRHTLRGRRFGQMLSFVATE